MNFDDTDPPVINPTVKQETSCASEARPDRNAGADCLLFDSRVNNKPWYKEGLRFQCTQCGKCCTGAPGYVWVSEDEIGKMAAFLNIEPQEFKRRYTRYAYGRLALVENKSSYDCVFLKDKKCQVYGARPKQCRKFPWWPENLESEKSWKEASKRCEGIDHSDAPLISFEKIEEE